MYWVRIEYAEEFDEVISSQFIEVNDDLEAIRSVEIFKDGSMDFASFDEPVGKKGVCLPEGGMPEASEIFSADGQFKSTIISEGEFGRLWSLATEI